MQVSKKEGRILNRAITAWREDNVISEEVSQTLNSAYEVMDFDWKRLAKYAFWISLACIVISISAVLADRWLMKLLAKIFSAPDSLKCAIFAILAAGFYTFGIKRKKKHPAKIYSNESIFSLGVVTTAVAIAYLGKAIDTGSGHFSLLILLASIIYAALALWIPSNLIWVFSMLSLGSWFGAETGYASGWGSYYLGMNYPMRFVVFGLALIFVGAFVFNQWKTKSQFLRPTRAIGLLYLFVALWIISIFGNYSDVDSWYQTDPSDLLYWGLLFAIAALIAIFHGIKYDDAMSRGFGLTFIFINLYTKFFEYFWSEMHEAIFFAILGLSFWLLGSKAEKIWQLSLLKPLANQKPQEDNLV